MNTTENRLRVEKRMSFDGKPYFKIVERVGYDKVSGKYLTIEWLETYGSEETANKAMEAAK